jgi:hypothetical protein
MCYHRGRMVNAGGADKMSIGDYAARVNRCEALSYLVRCSSGQGDHSVACAVCKADSNLTGVINDA